MTTDNDIYERRLEIGHHLYVFDGEDWECPSMSHNAERNFDELLNRIADDADEIERLRADLYEAGVIIGSLKAQIEQINELYPDRPLTDSEHYERYGYS